MEAIFLYFGKVILFSGVMFLYYQLFLKDKTFHHYNRFFLLATMLVSILLPLVKLDYFTISVNKDIYFILNKLQHFEPSKNTKYDYIYLKLALAVLGLVSVILSLKFFTGIIKIQQLKKTFPKENFEGINFYQTNLEDAPFSYFRSLFWKNSILIQSDLGKQILKHEIVHIEQKHTLDKIFVEVMKSVFWFNPVFYLIKKEINLIHEYLADKKAVKKNDTKAFAQMLLAGSFSGKPLPATSPFLNSNLKKRMKMLQKSKTKYSYARKIFALPLLFALVFAYLVNAKNKEIAKTNKEISLMVSSIKMTDTTKVEKKIAEQQQKIADVQKKLNEQSKKINEVSSEINKKSAELNQIAKEKGVGSKEYEAKSAEIDQLGMKINALADENDQVYVPNLENLNAELEKFFDEKNLQVDMETQKMDMEAQKKDFEAQKMDEKAQALDQKFNSKEFKRKMKEAERAARKAENIVNSKEFQRKIQEAQKKAQEAAENAEAITIRINSKEFQKQIQEAEENAKEAAKNAEKIVIELNNGDLKKTIASTPKKNLETQKFFQDKPFVIGLASPEESSYTKIYLNDKLITKEEMDKINPSDIATVNINKNNSNGKQENVISIRTK